MVSGTVSSAVGEIVQAITNTDEITGDVSSVLPSPSATEADVTDESAAPLQPVSATPAKMPVTGASSAGRGLAILLTVAAVVMFLIGISLAEKRGIAG
jgi:hypothetical protein